MRVAKRRLVARPAIQPDGIIVLQTSNWRDRVRAMNAAKDAEQGKGDAPDGNAVELIRALLMANEHGAAQR